MQIQSNYIYVEKHLNSVHVSDRDQSNWMTDELHRNQGIFENLQLVVHVGGFSWSNEFFLLHFPSKSVLFLIKLKPQFQKWVSVET